MHGQHNIKFRTVRVVLLYVDRRRDRLDESLGRFWIFFFSKRT